MNGWRAEVLVDGDWLPIAPGLVTFEPTPSTVIPELQPIAEAMAHSTPLSLAEAVDIVDTWADGYSIPAAYELALLEASGHDDTARAAVLRLQASFDEMRAQVSPGLLRSAEVTASAIEAMGRVLRDRAGRHIATALDVVVSVVPNRAERRAAARQARRGA